jgi:bacteriorhodopsin
MAIYHASGVLVFFLALIVDILGWLYTVNPLKKRLYSMITFTNLIAGWTYFAFLFDIGPVWTSFAGRPMKPLLYLEWIATTPTLIFLCAQLTSIPTVWVVAVMACDLSMIVIGLLSALASDYHWALYAASLFFGVPTLLGLYHFLTKAIAAILVKSDIKSLQTLRSITMMVWCVFPIVWQAAATNLISPSTESMMFAILDVNAKAIYSAILLGHNFFTIDQMEALNLLSGKKEVGKKGASGPGQDPLDYKALLESIETVDSCERTESMNKLLLMAKREVEKTKELQVAFLTGVMCFCTFVMVVFYAPRLYELFLAVQRSFTQQ